MLKKRIITGVILASVVYCLIVFSPTPWLVGAVAFVVLLAGYEWGRLAGYHAPLFRIIYGFSLLLLTVLCYQSRMTLNIEDWLYWLALVWWFLVLLWVVAYQYGFLNKGISPFVKLLLGYVVIVPFSLAFIRLHAGDAQGPFWVLYLLFVVAAADIGAYFAGKSFGNLKLASNVSPGKTLEGLLGGLFSVLLLSIVTSYLFALPSEKLGALILCSLLAAIFSVVGDLYESLMKRMVGLKDSGNILPGHGGVLDRIDGLMAAAPVFALSYLLWIV